MSILVLVAVARRARVHALAEEFFFTWRSEPPRRRARRNDDGRRRHHFPIFAVDLEGPAREVDALDAAPASPRGVTMACCASMAQDYCMDGVCGAGALPTTAVLRLHAIAATRDDSPDTACAPFYLRAEARRLLLEPLHHVHRINTLGEARVVVDRGRALKLAEVPRDDERL